MLKSRTAILPCLCFVLAATTLGSQSPAISGIVQRVIDGDTIVVSNVGTVRLIGVDTPETVDPRKPVEYFGREASAFTARIAAGKPVRLEFEGSRKDKYDRTLAYVYLADGRLLNAELIRQGYAHAYTQFAFSKMEEFRALQRDAMEHRRGLWAPSVERSAQSSSGPAAASPVKGGAAQAGSTSNETVYATKTGAKYHRAGCRFLARSQIPLSLREAAERYGPCSVCNPPVLRAATPEAPAVTSAPPDPLRPAATAGRCQAITKKGTQCSRRAQTGRNYCWQH